MSIDTENKEAIGTTTQETDVHSVPLGTEGKYSYILTGMYKSWFLSYASYVILERAVPHIVDGLKPVQRRILHTMSQMDDRLIKVANIVGYTMQLHPHGDASITDALVQIGQKDLLIDTQGNWGNILTGDGAAAARYIEARLLPFAKKVLFSPQITQYKPSYDGANKEPVYLPVKFPLLLAQGAEGIAVGLSSKILPHNVTEILQAAIAYLKGEEFVLYPDFVTGGWLDVSRYSDGRRGGAVKIRANIVKKDNKTLVIDQIPFSRTTSSLIESILKANEKGKIRIKKIDDKTAEQANIEIQLAPGTSSDKTIDALYAFTDCEISISPNCCVIQDDQPVFIGVSDVLKDNVTRTMGYLRQELELALGQLKEKHLAVSLEQLFITRRVYKDPEFEEAKNISAVLLHIHSRLEDAIAQMIRPVTQDDLKVLLDIRMARILKFNEEKSRKDLLTLEKEMEQIQNHLQDMRRYTIKWYEGLLKDVGDKYPRRTQLQSFDTILAAKVAEKNERLYVNKAEGFVGTSLRKDEFVCNVSEIDDIIVFFRNGKYLVTKVSDKAFVGKDIIHVARFIKRDKRTIYNVIYRDGKAGINYIKRFNVTSVTRDREYDLTMGTEGSRVLYFSANPNGEAETVRVVLKPKAKQRQLVFEHDFSELLIKGRSARGNILTKGEVFKVTLKEKGLSTLGGRKVWFDHDVNRLNYDERGAYLGEFAPEDLVLVILKSGEVYTTGFAESIHFERDILMVEKYNPNKQWTLVYYDGEQKYTYIKRFQVEPGKRENMLGGEGNSIVLLTARYNPQLVVSFGDRDEHRLPINIDSESFIAIKSIRAKGKRLTNYIVKDVLVADSEPLGEVSDEFEEAPTEAPNIPFDAGNDDYEDTTKLLEEVTGVRRLKFEAETNDE